MVSATAEGSSEPARLPRSTLGFFRAFREDPLGLFETMREVHGDVARGRIMHKKLLFLFHPEDIKHVLVDNVSNYRKQTRGYTQLRMLLGNGLVTSEGDFWLRQRRIAQPAFARRRIASFAETMLSNTDDRIATWGERIDLDEEMMALTLRIAGLTMLGVDLEQDAKSVGHALTTVLETFNDNIGSPIPFRAHMPFPKNLAAARARRELDEVVYAIIERRRQGEGGDDLLQMLIELEDEETGERMSDLQLRDEVMTMFLAGHETTANALTWTLALLAQNPAWRQRVEDELDEVFGNDDVDAMRARKLELLPRVLKESMRLRPPVWALGRTAAADDQVRDTKIDKGTLVFVSQWVTHRHPDLWRAPERFDPDRFLDEEDASRAPSGNHKYAYFPFAGGPRQCIGKHFAEMEMLLLATKILKRFRVDIDETPAPSATVTLRVAGGLPARVTRR